MNSPNRSARLPNKNTQLIFESSRSFAELFLWSHRPDGCTVSKLVKQRHMLLVMFGCSTYKLTWEQPTLDQPAHTPACYKVAELN
jgi:hypothetical protein